MRLLRRTLRVVIALFIQLNIMAVFHAFKFTYFYDDATTTVKKPEQMNGWEKTKVILFGLQYPKSVNTTRPNIPFDTLSLTTADKMRLSGWYIPRDSAKGTVILFHGHGSSSGKILAEAIFHNIPHNNKKLVVYEKAKHESLCNREPEKWKREIRAFLLNN